MIVIFSFNTIASFASVESESNTAMGGVGSILRQVWIGLETIFENSDNDEEQASIMYKFWGEDVDSSASSDPSDVFGTVEEDGFIQYYQGDYENVSYGSGSIASCGCGPASFAMVATAMTGTKITPEDAVKWCGNSYYVSRSRNKLDLFWSCGKSF